MTYRLLIVVLIITGVIANHNHEREGRFISFAEGGLLHRILGYYDWVEPWCSSLASLSCKKVIGDIPIFWITITETIGCFIQIKCKALDAWFDKWYPEGRAAAKGRSLGLGESMDLASEDLQQVVRVILEMASELEDGIQELGQEVNQTQIKELYGDDLDMYFSIRKKFNAMNITSGGGILNNTYSEDFLSAAIDIDNGLGPIIIRIYQMVVGTSSTQSLFKALPESCNQVNFFVRVISDSALLGNIAKTLTKTEVPKEVAMFKDLIVFIYSRFVADCGFPPDTVEKAQASLRSLLSPDFRSLFSPLNNTNKFGEVEEL